MPPLTWLFNGAEITEEQIEELKQKHPVKISLTFNNQEWINVNKRFSYVDHKVERVSYTSNWAVEVVDPAEKEKLWRAEEPIEKYPEDLPPEEVKKRDEEKLKRAQEETEESTTVARRRGQRIFVYGSDFQKLEVRLLYY